MSVQGPQGPQSSDSSGAGQPAEMPESTGSVQTDIANMQAWIKSFVASNPYPSSEPVQLANTFEAALASHASLIESLPAAAALGALDQMKVGIAQSFSGWALQPPPNAHGVLQNVESDAYHTNQIRFALQNYTSLSGNALTGALDKTESDVGKVIGGLIANDAYQSFKGTTPTLTTQAALTDFKLEPELESVEKLKSQVSGGATFSPPSQDPFTVAVGTMYSNLVGFQMNPFYPATDPDSLMGYVYSNKITPYPTDPKNNLYTQLALASDHLSQVVGKDGKIPACFLNMVVTLLKVYQSQGGGHAAQLVQFVQDIEPEASSDTTLTVWLVDVLGKGLSSIAGGEQGAFPPGYQGQPYQWVSDTYQDNPNNWTSQQFFESNGSNPGSMSLFELSLFNTIMFSTEVTPPTSPKALFSSLSKEFNGLQLPGNNGKMDQSWITNLLSGPYINQLADYASQI